MKTRILDESKIDFEIQKLEDERDEHRKGSAEWVELETAIDLVQNIIDNGTVKQS